MTAGIYARVSTSDQNCELQLRECRDFCTRYGWEYEEYIDTGWSGAKADRPQYLRLKDDTFKRKIDAVVVWKLDRLSRSLSEFVATALAWDNQGIRLIAVTQGIDTDKRNPASRLLMNILAAMAEFERELIRERVKAGIAKRKADGKQVGKQPHFITDSMIETLHMLYRGKESYTLQQLVDYYKKVTGKKVSRATMLRRVREWEEKIQQAKQQH